MRIAIAVASLSALVTVSTATPVFGYCSTKPPPEGLVPRCHQLTLVLVPESKVALKFALHQWMETCVSRGRAAESMDDESVDEVWALIEGRSMTQGGVTLLPEYSANSWQEGDKTCYGVASVRFDVKGAQGEVEVGEPTLTPNPPPTGDEVVEVAKKADAGLVGAGVAGADISRMRSVLHGMKTYGADFDDTYYTIAPIASGDLMRPGPACYREPNLNCLKPSQALASCEAHLARELVREMRNGASDVALGRMLEGRADQIDRGLRHMFLIQGQDSPGAVPCPNLPDAIWPAISRKTQEPKALYHWWGKGP